MSHQTVILREKIGQGAQAVTMETRMAAWNARGRFAKAERTDTEAQHESHYQLIDYPLPWQPWSTTAKNSRGDR